MSCRTAKLPMVTCGVLVGLSLIMIGDLHGQKVATPGISILTLDAFAPRREAIECHVRMNAWDELGVNGDYQVMMGDGGYLEYNNVDFGEGAKSFHVEISSNDPTMRKSALEIRLDNPAGKLVGKVKVRRTGGRTNYRTLSTEVIVGVEGIHNVFLVARGSAAPTQQRLFNITSFGFTRNTMPANKITSSGFRWNQWPIDKHFQRF
jgi:arabinoxylan arabinofuranohydrolase